MPLRLLLLNVNERVVRDAKGRAFARSVSGCSFIFVYLQPETTAAVAAYFIMCTAAAVRASIAHAGFLRFAEQWTFILRIHGCYPEGFAFLFGYVKDLVIYQAKPSLFTPDVRGEDTRINQYNYSL